MDRSRNEGTYLDLARSDKGNRLDVSSATLTVYADVIAIRGALKTTQVLTSVKGQTGLRGR